MSGRKTSRSIPPSYPEVNGPEPVAPTLDRECPHPEPCRRHYCSRILLACDYNRGVPARAGRADRNPPPKNEDCHGESCCRCCVAGVALGGPSGDGPDGGRAAVHAAVAAGTRSGRAGVAETGLRIIAVPPTRK